LQEGNRYTYHLVALNEEGVRSDPAVWSIDVSSDKEQDEDRTPPSEGRPSNGSNDQPEEDDNGENGEDSEDESPSTEPSDDDEEDEGQV